jgi:geranylgeranyl diphosphate synthase type I
MIVSEIRNQIQSAMQAAFPDAEARVAQFYAMQEYQLGWRDERLAPAGFDPGKLLRPRLSLLACRVAGGDPLRTLPLAAGIQLIHDFSLIHDDIEDQSATRRGRSTLWELWGLAQGINAGDGMCVIAHLSLHRLVQLGVPAEVVLKALQRFDETILTLCEGQFLDLSYEGDLHISEADYLAMISRKTAALVAAAAELGALVGGANAAMTRALFAFGQHLGIAFQMQDDILGVWGDPATTGKPPAADLYRRKLSLPMIYALRTAEQSERLTALYAKQHVDSDDVRQILAILEAAQARRYTEHLATSYHQAALAALDSLHDGDAAALAELRGIAEGLLGRTT